MSEFRRRLMMMQRAGGGFPAELQKCEWIGNNKSYSNFIKFGFKDYSYRRYEISVNHVSSSKMYGFFIGTLNNIEPEAGWEIWAFSDSENVAYQSPIGQQTWIIDLQNGICKVNETNKPAIRYLNGIGKLSLFLRYDNWIGSNPAEYEVEYITIKDYGEITYNLLPCYVKSGNTFEDIKGNTCPAGTIGMYDTVNCDFYTNDGNGNFTKGADI